MFEDVQGRKQGPHSFAELFYWYKSNYLHESVKVIILKQLQIIIYLFLQIFIKSSIVHEVEYAVWVLTFLVNIIIYSPGLSHWEQIWSLHNCISN